jgi:hypothetical protein
MIHAEQDIPFSLDILLHPQGYSSLVFTWPCRIVAMGRLYLIAAKGRMKRFRCATVESDHEYPGLVRPFAGRPSRDDFLQNLRVCCGMRFPMQAWNPKCWLATRFDLRVASQALQKAFPHAGTQTGAKP